ncbi:MAG: InlB B-repeat-containing protein [Lachnospiraceae bacterium]|nr:InlB B-repeat-containing protein [Lachnospiraceae bacterium]
MKQSLENKEDLTMEKESQADSEGAKKRWIGRGIYGKKDVPIRILDGLIGVFVVAIIVLVAVFAVNGGYYVTFHTDGGSEIAEQKLNYGDYIEQPEEPVKPGYEFLHWVTSEDEYLAQIWNFAENKVEGDMTLYAVWQPAAIVVKFDLAGGSFSDETTGMEKQVIFGETYGELPIPEKEGYLFDGWVYSQQVIKEDTVVFMTGEHILTARWVEE